jgi:hypothetical protein
MRVAAERYMGAGGEGRKMKDAVVKGVTAGGAEVGVV